MKLMLEGVGFESRGLEFKSSFQWIYNNDRITQIQAKTIRTILGMSNTQNGGQIIIGIKELSNSQISLDGVTPEHLASFENNEAIARMIDSYSSGRIEYDIKYGEFNNTNFIVISIKEFNRDPNFALKDLKSIEGHHIIVKSDLYVRADTAQPQTIKMSPNEFREIITMVEERDESFIKRFIVSDSIKVKDDLSAKYSELDRDL